MPRRKYEAAEEKPVAVLERPKPRPKAVTAIFHPDGSVTVNLTTPSGRPYHIEPRVPFEIAGEDVDWFFYEWDWRFRQRLCRVEEYAPPAGYFDATPDGKPKAPGSGQYFDATPSAAPPASAVETVGTPGERETRERGAQPKAEETEPVAVVAGADD